MMAFCSSCRRERPRCPAPLPSHLPRPHSPRPRFDLTPTSPRPRQVLGSLVGGVAGLLLLLLFSRWLLQHSPLALRIGSTFLLIGGMVAVPIILSYVSLFQLLLLFAAVGYFLAAAIRIPFMFGCPRYGRLPMQAYDYLCGGLLLGLCLVCSAPQFCRALQTKSLLSAVFERRVAHNEIMRLLQTTE